MRTYKGKPYGSRTPLPISTPQPAWETKKSSSPTARRFLFYLRPVLRSRLARLIPVLLFLITLFDAIRINSHIIYVEQSSRASRTELHKPQRFSADHAREDDSKNIDGRDGGSSHPRTHTGERIYIAAMHFNDGKLLEEYWANALLDLVDALGKENVWVSIYESGSWDHTRWVLQNLDYTLWERKIPRRIELGNDTHAAEVSDAAPSKEGHVRTRSGGWAPRRIPFLSKLRNKTLVDLRALEATGVHFDKVLFLNDVIFTTDDILALMDTNQGEYAAACAMDYSSPPTFYDTFALRDAEGRGHGMLTWPYFQPGRSKTALLEHTDAVPVKSCWNGAVVMPVEPFISSSRPLEFRGIPDSLAQHHLEGSECCLVHADNPLSKNLGVFLNPHVRVGYNEAAYRAVNPPDGNWVGVWRVFYGLWLGRFKSWLGWWWRGWEQWSVRRRFNAWQREGSGDVEPGLFCLINEMQILIAMGWAHM